VQEHSRLSSPLYCSPRVKTRCSLPTAKGTTYFAFFAGGSWRGVRRSSHSPYQLEIPALKFSAALRAVRELLAIGLTSF
jgi:hypothetical protein